MTWVGGRWGLAAPLAVLFLAGCADAGLSDVSLDEFVGAPRADFEELAKGSYSEYRTNGFRAEVAENQVEWDALWVKHEGDSRSEPPAVDFESQFVVALFMGKKMTGGYSIRVVDVPFADGKHHVGYATGRPGKDCMTAQAVTYPFHIVAVARMGADETSVVFHNAGQNDREC